MHRTKIFKQSQADQCVRSQVSTSGETMTGTYTDDTLRGSPSIEEKVKVKQEIWERYRIKDTDSVKFALGMKLTHDQEAGTATLAMSAYWETLPARHGLNTAKLKQTPFTPGTTLSPDSSPIPPQ